MNKLSLPSTPVLKQQHLLHLLRVVRAKSHHPEWVATVHLSRISPWSPAASEGAPHKAPMIQLQLQL
jgi:hypothetical protein